jgi:hypothetical protein
MHYFDIGIYGQLRRRQNVDQLKAEVSKRAGVTLIKVPYWWDKSKESLMATIRQARPDIELPISTSAKPIPEFISSAVRVTYEPVIAKDLNNTSPVGMWMTEYIDGIRFFWDGKSSISVVKNGRRKVTVPKLFASKMPSIPFEGILQTSNPLLVHSLISDTSSPLWKQAKMIVFDDPYSQSLVYEKRLEHLKKHLTGFPNIQVIEPVMCSTRQQFETFLKSVTQL